MADKTASEMIREAISAGVAVPAEIEKWIFDKYATRVTKSNINQVKQAARKATALPRAMLAPLAQKITPAVVVGPISLTMAEYNALDSLKQRLGRDGIRTVVESLWPF